MELVEKEIGNIQLERKKDTTAIEEKTRALEEAQALNKKLTAELKTSEEDVEEIKKVLIAYRTEKDKEVEELNQKLIQTESDMKILIREIDRMKKNAAEKIKVLGSLFK